MPHNNGTPMSNDNIPDKLEEVNRLMQAAGEMLRELTKPSTPEQRALADAVAAIFGVPPTADGIDEALRLAAEASRPREEDEAEAWDAWKSGMAALRNIVAAFAKLCYITADTPALDAEAEALGGMLAAMSQDDGADKESLDALTIRYKALLEAASRQKAAIAEGLRDIMERLAAITGAQKGARKSARPRPQGINPTPTHMEIANSNVYYYAREIIARGDFTQNGGEKWPTGRIRRGGLNADVQIKPNPATEEPNLTGELLAAWQENAADIAMEMDDATADVLDYIAYEVANGASNFEQDVVFSAYRFSQLRGLQKHKAGNRRRGGYEVEYRRNFAREVEKLAHVWIRVAEMDVVERDANGKRRRSTRRGIESRVIVVSARAGQINPDGSLEPDCYRGRLGPLFAESIFGTWRQMALVSVKALGYDPYRRLPEKRLTRYLSWQWRIRNGTGNYLQPYEVSTLLKAADMTISKSDPARTKDRLEKALETLAGDGVVSAWQYGEGWDEEIVGTPGWAQRWADWRVIVEPPQEIIDHYKTIPPVEMKPQKALPAISARLRAALAATGRTQLQAAEDIGISPTTLCRIIKGQTPSRSTHNKISAWLDAIGG